MTDAFPLQPDPEPTDDSLIEAQELPLSKYEVRALPEKLMALREHWLDLIQKIEDTKNVIRNHKSVVMIPAELQESFTNTFALMFYLNSALGTLLTEMVEFIDSPENQARLSEGVADELISAGIASYTPNIVAPGFLENQGNRDFHQYDLQSNEAFRQKIFTIVLRFMNRPANHPVEPLSNEQLLVLVEPVKGKGALVNLAQSVDDYVDAYNKLGYVDMHDLAQITKLLADYFDAATQLTKITMYGVGKDLLNNVFSLTSGILHMAGFYLPGADEVPADDANTES